jgi:branched-chain amino acid transport system ATP-binding protein
MTRPGTHLSGGERKMLSIARTLALDARLLLLDEPFEGLSPTVIPSIKESIREIVRFGRTILIAESELQHVPEYSNRLYVIERGEIVFAGDLAQARDNPADHRRKPMIAMAAAAWRSRAPSASYARPDVNRFLRRHGPART